LKEVAGGITFPKGFKAAGVKAGIKKNGKEDVALVFSTVEATWAGRFTTNKFPAAPVLVSKAALKKVSGRAIILNAGCANACTGEQGMIDAQNTARQVASLLDISADAVLVASTGVIGVPLPMEKLSAGVRQAVAELSEYGGEKASQAIMTTDTFVKTCGFVEEIGGVSVRFGGMSKGAGMICPNMATVLGLITTDAAVSPDVLQKALTEAVEVSFNRITVDGDMSTNDMLVVLANGMAGNPQINSLEGPEYEAFAATLKMAALNLAKKVARDGEGATKFIEIEVQGALNMADARKAGMAIANSPLVKTAFFGQDPNWGRILCAAGYSGAELSPEKTTLSIGGVQIVEAGLGAKFDEKELRRAMGEREIKVVINLAVGNVSTTVYTCDMSYEYVKINGEYTT
jgi:glutamate N-acetyltransferase/amino-acid N-acetyltransferase